MIRNLHDAVLVGPTSVTPNGQSIAFQQTVNAISNSITIDNSCNNISKIIHYYCLVFIAVITYSAPVYFTCRRIEQFASYQAAQKHVVCNFYSEEFSNLESRSKQSSSKESTRILYFSNLLYSKGFSILVETVDKLTQRGIDLKLDICGVPQGDEFWSKQQVNDYLSKIDNPNITYHGPIYGPEKVKFFNDSDIFALPSFYRTEEAPLSIIEALASGCYVVASAVGSITNMLSGTISTIVNPSVLDVTQALLEYESFSIDERRRIAKTNKFVASFNFAPQKYNDAIGTIIRG